MVKIVKLKNHVNMKIVFFITKKILKNHVIQILTIFQIFSIFVKKKLKIKILKF